MKKKILNFKTILKPVFIQEITVSKKKKQKKNLK